MGWGEFCDELGEEGKVESCGAGFIDLGKGGGKEGLICDDEQIGVG